MRRRRPAGRLAALFAADVLDLGTQVLDRYGGGASRAEVPVTVPVDGRGVVVVSAAPPELADPGAVRRPARLDLARTAGGLAAELAFTDGRALRLPGVGRPAPQPLGSIAFDIAGAGLAVSATGVGGEPVAVEVDEATARQLATALLLTFRVKLAKAPPPASVPRAQQEA